MSIYENIIHTKNPPMPVHVAHACTSLDLHYDT